MKPLYNLAIIQNHLIMINPKINLIKHTLNKLELESFTITFSFKYHKPLETFKQTINYIKYKAQKQNFNKFYWSFTDGPTNYKHLSEIVKYLEDGISEYQTLEMVTDLNQNKKYWAKWCMASELLQKRYITTFFNKDIMDENEFSDKCLYLMSENVYVTILQNEGGNSHHRFLELGLDSKLLSEYK